MGQATSRLPDCDAISRRQLLAAGCAASCALLIPSARAQALSHFPNRAVRLIVPYASGGPLDSVGRALAQRLAVRWGQPVVVENRPGASAAIGTDYVAKSPADGYTLLVCNVGEIAISPFTQAVAYDPLKDFVPVTQLVSGPMVLLVNANAPLNSVQDVVAAARAQPNKLSFASAGSITQIAGDMFNSAARTQILNVSYKGASPAITDLLGGHVSMTFLGISAAAPMIASGKLKGIAVTTTRRSTLLPDLPAISEIFPGFDVNSWIGLMSPSGTPKAVVQQIYEDCAAVMKQLDFTENLRGRGLDIEASSPEVFASVVSADVARYSSALKLGQSASRPAK